MKVEPVVSVIIVNWNARDHLERCLVSLTEQQVPHRVIVFDNCSTDDSVGLLQKKFPAVQLISSDTNVGFAGGNNRAASSADGRYLLLLNPDTEVGEGAIEKLVAFADAHPEIGALGPKLVNPDGSHQRSCWRGFPGLGMALSDAFYLWKIHWFPFRTSEYTPDELAEPRTVDHLLGACMLIRRSAWSAVGGLDENYFLFLEETDWCWRAQQAGWKIGYYPVAQVTHFGQASMKQDPLKNIPQFYKSYLYFYRAHHRGHSPGAWALKGIIALACLIRIGMWRERAARARDTAARELARGMTTGYRQTLIELGTFRQMEGPSAESRAGADRRGAGWFIFLILLVCYVYFLPRWADWNVNSRMNLVLAIVDQNTLAIDSYYRNTGDYAFYNGHYYSDKAPGSAFVGVPFYFLFKLLGGPALVSIAAEYAGNAAFLSTQYGGSEGLNAATLNYFAALIVVTFFTSALPSALLGVLVYRIARQWADKQWYAVALALAFGLATPAFAYANNLYGHQLSAFLLFGAFYLVLRHAQSRRRNLYAALTGFMLGVALITEYPTALIVAAVGIYAVYRWRNLVPIALAAAAGLIPLLAMMAHNYAIFQTPLPVGYLYSPLYSELHHTGLISLTYPKPEVLFQLGFGVQRGLFLLSPFLLLALPGFYWFAKERTLRAEFLVCLWAVLSFMLFNSSSAMWQGGFAVGPRYLVPMLPFFSLAVIFVFNHTRTRGARVGIFALIAVSWLMVWIVSLSGQQFPQFQPFPLVQYSLPELVRGQIARNMGMFLNLKNFASVIPLLVALGGIVLVYLWRTRPPHLAPPHTARNSPAALP